MTRRVFAELKENRICHWLFCHCAPKYLKDIELSARHGRPDQSDTGGRVYYQIPAGARADYYLFSTQNPSIFLITRLAWASPVLGVENGLRDLPRIPQSLRGLSPTTVASDRTPLMVASTLMNTSTPMAELRHSRILEKSLIKDWRNLDLLYHRFNFVMRNLEI